MRTTIIPAQITTIEDKIAGSFNLTQILILMIPVLWTALVYIILPTRMTLSAYKLGLILICTLICITLSIRVKDKLVLDWLKVVCRYYFRPKYWLFNKNDLTNRTLDLPATPKVTAKPQTTKNLKGTPAIHDIKVADLVKIQSLIDSGRVVVRYQWERK